MFKGANAPGHPESHTNNHIEQIQFTNAMPSSSSIAMVMHLNRFIQCLCFICHSNDFILYMYVLCMCQLTQWILVCNKFDSTLNRNGRVCWVQQILYATHRNIIKISNSVHCSVFTRKMHMYIHHYYCY